MALSTNGTGNALLATITDVANLRPAIVGTTKGGGSGVYGETGNAAGRGVTGQGTKGATGVYGQSDQGIGVFAKSASGDALKVMGKVAFSRSGTWTIPSNKKSVTIPLAGVTTSSMVFATLQSQAGEIAVANVTPKTGSFTINLTSAPSSSVQVAWFVLE